MAIAGALNMCPQCSQQFIVQAPPQPNRSEQEPIPISSVTAGEARPMEPVPAGQTSKGCSEDDAFVMWVRGMDADGNVKWVHTSALSEV